MTYTTEALNDFGPGLETTVTAYIGVDVPALPADVHVEMVDDVPTISWEAPTTGAHGGYIDPAKLTYYVQRGTDDLLVDQQLTALSATDRYFSMPAEQEELFYYVYAATTTGLGDGQVSNVIVVGPPYSLPFHESFAGGYLEHSLWSISTLPRRPSVKTPSWSAAASRKLTFPTVRRASDLMHSTCVVCSAACVSPRASQR